jgi:hypothetical protein
VVETERVMGGRGPVDPEAGCWEMTVPEGRVDMVVLSLLRLCVMEPWVDRWWEWV